MKNDTILADTVFAKVTTIATGVSASIVYSDWEFWVRFGALCLTGICGILATVAWSYTIQNRRLEREERRIRIQELENEAARKQS